MELTEIVTAISTFVGGDQGKAKEVVTALRSNDGTKPVAQELINIGNGGKAAELKPRIEKLEHDLKTANDTIAAKDGEIDQIKNDKAPDRKKIEEEVTSAFQKKLDVEKLKREKAEADSKALRKRVAVDAFVRQLTEPDEQGVSVETDWARKVVAAEFDDRITEAEDGTQRVLQPGSTLPYDGTLDEQLAALAKDARKKVPAKYQVTGQDRGPGIGGGGGGGGGTVTVEKIADAKAKTGDYGL